MVQYLPTFDTTPTIVWSQIHVHISGLPGWFDLYRQEFLNARIKINEDGRKYSHSPLPWQKLFKMKNVKQMRFFKF